MFLRPLVILGVRRIKWTSLNEKRELIVNKLKDFLSCSPKVAMKIYEEYPVIRSVEQLNLVKRNVEFLIEQEIPADAIAENAFLLMMKYGEIRFRGSAEISRSPLSH